VEFVAGDIHGGEFVVGDLDAGRIGHGIELATDLETGFCSCRADQLNDLLMADQRLLVGRKHTPRSRTAR
jgi:hypothetical protein